MKKILLVEDNEDNRELVCALIGDAFDVESCTDAVEALALLDNPQTHLPDLMLVDISLPGMDGIQFLFRIRSDPRLAGIPAIALTAHAMKDDKERFIGSGFDGYFSKPIVDEMLLIETINTVIESRGRGRE
ncbi:response regulator [Syntrophobacter fumaroxidans]|uniref:Response regulator receiver protein n=1 Tax=Syntrophobacter fumaroxidans (strain DSM 10017 / MPOB) TaxID=335543 RepID=A0LKD7_SYNFM|nr:response regulator [Syntrophobacter fumaroxidans]ABK17889.1 response regulator receiver protein [Syntrophobacter fumaroxidans MPOB]